MHLSLKTFQFINPNNILCLIPLLLIHSWVLSLLTQIHIANIFTYFHPHNITLVHTNAIYTIPSQQVTFPVAILWNSRLMHKKFKWKIRSSLSPPITLKMFPNLCLALHRALAYGGFVDTYHKFLPHYSYIWLSRLHLLLKSLPSRGQGHIPIILDTLESEEEGLYVPGQSLQLSETLFQN